jgi:HK97 family phage major capsid protein
MKKQDAECKRELTEREGKKFARFQGQFTMAREIAPGKTEGWFSVTSEEPCMDFVYRNGQWQRAYVVLSHAPGAIEMTRMDKGMNLRDGHGGDQVAKLEGITVRGNKLGGVGINWSVSERAQILRADYESGVRDDVSVEADYSPDALVIIGEKNGIPVVRVQSWVPLAAALAIVTPADPKVGTNRTAEGQSATPPTETKVENKKTATAEAQNAPNVIVRSKSMPEKTPEVIAREKQGADAAEMFALCSHFGVPNEKAMQFARELTPIDEVRAVVLRDYAGQKPVAAKTESAAAPMQREIVGEAEKNSGRKYSLSRAILAMAAQAKGEKSPVDAGFEIECSQQAEKTMQRKAQGILVPWDAPMQRTFAITASGSNVIAQNLRPDLFVDFLYAKMVLNRLGVTMLPGLVGDILLPKQSASVTTGWVDETTAVSESDPTMIQVKGTPHTAGAYCDITRQLLLQSTPAADIIVQNSLVNSLARTIQTGAFHGTGSNNQPTGLFTALLSGYQNQGAVAASTITTPGSFSEIEAMKALPEESNVDSENSKFVMRPTAFRKLKGVGRVGTTGAVPIADEEKGAKYVADSVCETTSALTSGYGAYGAFDTMALCMWGATDLIIDPYSLSTKGQLRIVALQNVDIIHRYLVAFGWSTTFGS